MNDVVICQKCQKKFSDEGGPKGQETWREEGWKEVEDGYICPDCQKEKK